MTFFCDKAIPIGINIIRDFDEDGCGVATRVFLVLYEGQTFGTTQFKSRSEYDQWINTNCGCCTNVKCDVVIGDCLVYIGNCLVKI